MTVKAVEPNRRILVECRGHGGPSTIEWKFTSRRDGTTFVEIRNADFGGNGDEIVKQAINSTQGFAPVLAGLKALLEHNVRLGLVADRFPEGFDQP